MSHDLEHRWTEIPVEISTTKDKELSTWRWYDTKIEWLPVPVVLNLTDLLIVKQIKGLEIDLTLAQKHVVFISFSFVDERVD